MSVPSLENASFLIGKSHLAAASNQLALVLRLSIVTRLIALNMHEIFVTGR